MSSIEFADHDYVVAGMVVDVELLCSDVLSSADAGLWQSDAESWAELATSGPLRWSLWLLPADVDSLWAGESLVADVRSVADVWWDSMGFVVVALVVAAVVELHLAPLRPQPMQPRNLWMLPNDMQYRGASFDLMVF